MGCCASVKTHTLSDGSLFTGKGNVKQGVLYNGKGVVYYPNGATFKGKIKEWVKSGNGIYEQSEDYQYQGEWANDTSHGKGIWKTRIPTDDKIQRYSGDFQNGFMTGKAVISYSNGVTYRGEVINGRRSGEGTMAHNTNTVYVGQWANNKYHGMGLRTYDTGEFYQGYFVDGKRHGRGNYGSAHSTTEMDAEWVRDIPQGIYSGEFPSTKIIMGDDESTRYSPKILECVICLDREPKLVYVPCRHLCVCTSCPPQSMCPVCRQDIHNTIEPIYS